MSSTETTAATGTPRVRDIVTIHWLGMPWFVTYKGPYIDTVNVNGHWLNAAYVLGIALVRDLETVALHRGVAA